MNKAYPANTDIADVLERIADLLEAQDANPYRVNAYRRGAKVISTLSRSTAEMASDDDQKLEDLPDIGKRIVAVVKEYADTGLSSMLERLENQISAEDLFTTVPGIGEALARRIHADLDVDTLEGLELAAYDGRLQTVAGIGHRRAKSIRDSVSAILNRSGRRRARKIRQFEKAKGDVRPASPSVKPSIATILKVDATYRRLADAGKLKTISPRRFNPEGKSWLPVMHTEMEGWLFTALFSNTARAHELNKTRDRVVVYYEQHGNEHQCTVVTEQRGRLKGRRIVRRREKECLSHYSD